MPGHVVVIGAGAAGTMAAIFAAKQGARVTLLERTRDGGRKILISGGGRCNVLPIALDESRYVTGSSPNTMRKMLRSWPLIEQVRFFEEELGIPLVEEHESGKRFPASHRARDVRDGLLAHARASGADVRFDTLVVGVTPADGDKWTVATAGAPPVAADAVIIATGGLSVPNTGSDGTGLRAAEALGHTIHATYAALTPLLADAPRLAALSGISLTVTLTARHPARSATARGGFLFTHRGYSGPSVLDVSHVAVRSRVEPPRAVLTVQWSALGEADWEAALAPSGSRTVQGALRAALPERLAAVLVDMANVDPQRSLADLRRDERRRLVDVLVRGPLPFDGDEGYKKAEVTGGGVSLGEVDPRTMESRLRRGLYLCGEVLDAFGPIGGYNFCWAWATGRAAGVAAAAAVAGDAATGDRAQ